MKKSAVILVHLVFWIIMFFIPYYFICNQQGGEHEKIKMLAETISKIPNLKEQTGWTWTFGPKVFADNNIYLNVEVFKEVLSGVGKMFIPFYFSFFLLPLFIRKRLLLIVPVIFLIGLYVYSVLSVGNGTYKFLEAAFSIIFISFFIALGCLFRILTEWFKNLEIKTQLEKQNLTSELALLKNQISPHFLFNTLNNIDSLIKSNKDKASETLVKLSEILRYMIYDTNVDKVNLFSEIKNIENYIDLQKIQFANNELVSLSIRGVNENILIAPMLFIPFVENAFKHCSDKSVRNAIQIKFSVENKTVNFECANVFDSTQKITKDNSSGIGLAVIKRRLDILYPKKHKLDIIEENSTFNVKLSLTINEN
jgi:two-component system LytT family sensor kinase